MRERKVFERASEVDIELDSIVRILAIIITIVIVIIVTITTIIVILIIVIIIVVIIIIVTIIIVIIIISGWPSKWTSICRPANIPKNANVPPKVKSPNVHMNIT